MHVGGSYVIALPVPWLKRLQKSDECEHDHILLDWDAGLMGFTVTASPLPEPQPGQPEFMAPEDLLESGGEEEAQAPEGAPA